MATVARNILQATGAEKTLVLCLLLAQAMNMACVLAALCQSLWGPILTKAVFFDSSSQSSRFFIVSPHSFMNCLVMLDRRWPTPAPSSGRRTAIRRREFARLAFGLLDKPELTDVVLSLFESGVDAKRGDSFGVEEGLGDSDRRHATSLNVVEGRSCVSAMLLSTQTKHTSETAGRESLP
eukprot:TRINITY_DN8526_c0_g1_i1.p1 TRINITY_DN8526_c0_g1~~TRINITY_DN8526_c0_g1_i1.p1  ORF type:complete len:180 (+),score=9.31 TRINITY_DN8526_c0_g1_i1:724-1263(+)